MRQTLSRFFNETSRKGRKAAAALLAGFMMAASAGSAIPAGKPAAPADIKKLSQATFSQTTYWKHPEYNIITRVEPCKDKGLCMTVHNIDTEQDKNRLLLARLLGIAKPVDDAFSGIVTRYEPAPEEVQGWLVDRYCSYEAETKMTRNADGSWSGTIHSPFNNKSYGIQIELKDEKTAIASGYIPELSFLKKSVEVRRIPGPVSPCWEFSGRSYWTGAENSTETKLAAAPVPKRK